MAPRPIQILATGTALPPVADADAWAARAGMTAAELHACAGVRQRHAVRTETATDLGAAAARAALDAAGLDAAGLDLVLGACGSRAQPLPGPAALVHRALGLGETGIPAFDVDSTCLSFVTALDVAAMWVASGRARHVLVVSAEVATAAVDWSHPESAALFGDGAAAAVLGPAAGIADGRIAYAIADGSANGIANGEAHAYRTNPPLPEGEGRGAGSLADGSADGSADGGTPRQDVDSRFRGNDGTRVESGNRPESAAARAAGITDACADGRAAGIADGIADGRAAGSAVLAARHETYSLAADLCRVRGGGTALPPSSPAATPRDFLFEMDGPRLFRLAAEALPAFARRLCADAGLALDDVDVVVPHQASAATLRLLGRRLGVADRIVSIVETHGNCIAASIPLALDHAIGTGRLRRGQTALLIGTSAGVSLGGLVLRY